MSVYVDQLIDYGKKFGSAGPEWCHLTADTPDELHAFAAKLGLKRRWCSDHTQPGSSLLHYDLTRGMRFKAVKLGAIDISGQEHEHYRRMHQGASAKPTSESHP